MSVSDSCLALFQDDLSFGSLLGEQLPCQPLCTVPVTVLIFLSCV